MRFFRHKVNSFFLCRDYYVNMNTTAIEMDAMTQMEADLLRRVARQRDAEAFSELTRKYAGLVYGVCFRVCGDKDEAADATQDTFFHLLRQAGTVSGSLSGWLHRVATRRAIDLIRRQSARRRREHDYAAQALLETDSWSEVAPVVDEALDELGEESREVLFRHFLQGQSMVEIAEAAGVSQPTISRRVERALGELREKLRGRGVVVGVGVLGVLMVNSTQAAPAAVLTELGKIALAGISASAASPGIGAAKAATTLSGGTLVLALIGAFAGLLGLKRSLDGARSPQERRLALTLARLGVLYAGNFAIVFFTFFLLGVRQAALPTRAISVALAILGALWVAGVLGLAWWGRCQVRQLHSRNGEPVRAEWDWHPRRRSFEFKSQWSLLGLPLVHIKFGDYSVLRFGMARGWIALGDTACGVLFGAGWFAVGGMAVGFVGMGLGAAGLLACGGLACGVVAAGGVSLGSISLAWFAACGARAFSLHYAIGAMATAPVINAAAWRELLAEGWLGMLLAVLKHAGWLAVFAAWPFILWSRQERDEAAPEAESRGVSNAEPRFESLGPVSGGSPAQEAPPRYVEEPGSAARRRRKLLLRLALLVSVLCVSAYCFAVLPHRMKTVWSLAAYLVALTSLLGVVFTLVGLFVRHGSAPGWQIRCPECNLTVDASVSMVRIGAAGTERRWGWCEGCRRHRWLLIEPTPAKAPRS
jgi:RNA polymerase sigma factor (sigma-70 family)